MRSIRRPIQQDISNGPSQNIQSKGITFDRGSNDK
jgi:hypothetical protein